MTHGDQGGVLANPARRRGWVRWFGLAAAGALLVAAIVTVARQHELIADALDSIKQPDVADVALLLGAIVANVVLAGLLFSVLMARYGRVGVAEMQALIASATLLNFLPLRPGLFGRIAYHKTFNAIPAAASIKTVLQAITLSLLVAAYLALALVATRWLGVPFPVAVALPVPVLGATMIDRRARLWAVAGLVRYLEVMVWAVRYHAAFALLGSPIEPTSALALACIACVTMLVPFFSNGLGLREWATGIAAPLLTPYVIGLGLVAEIVNRAAELLVVTILGVIGMACLSWYRKS